jgi:two-component system OmpR family sensor kinase
MFNSVRTRLTVWYTTVMALVLVVLSGTTYLLLRKDVVRRADAQAIELADSFLSTVDAEMGDGSKPESADVGIAAAISEHRFRDVVFVVFSSQGQLLGVSKSHEQLGRTTEPSPEAVSASLRPLLVKTGILHSVYVSGRIYRGYVRHISIEGDAAILVVLQSLHRQNEFLAILARTFVIVIPLAIVLAAAGGYLLARRSLSPVVVMSNQASHIGAENLHDRLVVKNPRDELGKLAASFNELLDRLDQSFERQRRFVADVSHELRTPVAILCGEAEVTLAQETRTEQEYRESLQILKEEAKRLKLIVEDLFTLARADAGQHPLALSDFYLDELAAECSKNVRTLASAKDISISSETRGDVVVRGDEVLLRRMLLNLLDNAIKYTPRGGKVALRSGEENGCYRLSVEDSGPGIPADLQSRIFERFFRVDKARTRGESDGGGAGLGLAIASWIAGAHGGRLELTRSTSKGSLFTVYLPKGIPKS